MTSLAEQVRLLKNNDPEAGEETRGWNSAIDAVLSLLPAEIPINKMFVGPYQGLDLPTDNGRVSVSNESPHFIEVIAHRVPA